jgi:hypothetical protein
MSAAILATSASATGQNRPRWTRPGEPPGRATRRLQGGHDGVGVRRLHRYASAEEALEAGEEQVGLPNGYRRQARFVLGRRLLVAPGVRDELVA